MAVERNDHDEAHTKFSAAVDAFAGLQRPFWLAVTRCELGEWLMAQGREDDARGHLAQARATFEQLRAPAWLERARSAAQDQPSSSGFGRLVS